MAEDKIKTPEAPAEEPDGTKDDNAESAVAKPEGKAPKLLHHTQDQLNKLFAERAERERQKVVKELGVTGTWQDMLGELQTLKQEKDERLEAERQRQEEIDKQRGRFDKIELDFKDKIRTLEQEKAETERTLTDRYNSRVINDELTRLYLQLGGHKPALGDAIAAILRDARNYAFGVGDNDAIALNDREGNPLRDDNMDELTLENYVQRFLRERPHFREGSQAQGSDIPTGSDSPDMLSDAERKRAFDKDYNDPKLSGRDIAKKYGLGD